jgi:DNA-binding NtrC family response regulator
MTLAPSQEEVPRRDTGARASESSGDRARDARNHLLGESPAFHEMMARLRRIASAAAPVLIEGETGVGKELAARAIHYLSARRDHPFIPLNCGAIPDNLVESELFGHARGAFTDARQARRGVVMQAHHGTLFLDEVDSLSAKAQVSLLRFLQDYRYRPVGQDYEHSCDVRIVAASNRPLRQLVGNGAFRGDLLYRLDILGLWVPPLRERGGDAVLLAEHFLRQHCAAYQRGEKHLHAATVHWIAHHPWPGNVREVENLMHKLALLEDGDCVLYCGEARPGWPPTPSGDSDANDEWPAFRDAKAQAVSAFEKRYLASLLDRTLGNVSAAARLAGKERRALGKLLRKHGIGASPAPP